MGLMIIVIMILFLAIIFLSFALREKPDIGEIPRESVMANSLMTALLQTSIDGQPLKEKFPECYTNREICESLGNRIGFMLNLSVPPNKDFDFKLKADDEELIAIGSCKRGTVSVMPIRRENIDFLANLKIC
jgi:hypothetical protein